MTFVQFWQCGIPNNGNRCRSSERRLYVIRYGLQEVICWKLCEILVTGGLKAMCKNTWLCRYI